MSNIAVANLTKRKVPDLPFVEYKEKILGQTYDLSLVFCGPAKARELSLVYRHKDKEANVLSFPLSETSGEIFIKLPTSDFSVPHLFIHGLLHLKGLSHGSKMESEERRYLKLFGIHPVQKN
ncbi:MAG TPA: rRNA maturation RNAse YbeY [Candidatus Paceibacterota bacterium]|nr:rRNA maturation RNAse YbeY [Candidatus Paceibacterota bacterium]